MANFPDKNVKQMKNKVMYVFQVQDCPKNVCLTVAVKWVEDHDEI